MSAASLAAAKARSSKPINVSAAPEAPSAKASRRDNWCMNPSSRTFVLSPSREDSFATLADQIIFAKGNIRAQLSSAWHRLQVVAKAFALIGFLAHVAKHRKEIVRAHIAGGAGDFAFRRRHAFQRRGRLREELKRRRKAHAIFCSQFLFRELGPVKIGDLARSNDIELQHFKVGLYIIRYSRLREIDQVRFLAIWTAPQLPHDHKALTRLARSLKILGKVKKAFQKPGLLVEPIVGQNRLVRARAEGDQRTGCYNSGQQVTPDNHGHFS